MSKKLLLFIDFQSIFTPNSPLGPNGWPVPKFYNALDNALLVYEKLKSECQTISTRYIPPNPISGEWIEYFNQFPKIPKNDKSPCYDLAEDVPNNFVISVPKFGKWPSIMKSQVSNGCLQMPTEIYITGVSTDCCVLSTALAAVDSGIKVYIVTDACASSSDANQNNALNVLKGYAPNIELITTNEILNDQCDDKCDITVKKIE